MQLYRFLTGPDDAAFCKRVSAALNKGWQLAGNPTLTFDPVQGRVICGQAIVKGKQEVLLLDLDNNTYTAPGKPAVKLPKDMTLGLTTAVIGVLTQDDDTHILWRRQLQRAQRLGWEDNRARIESLLQKLQQLLPRRPFKKCICQRLPARCHRPGLRIRTVQLREGGFVRGQTLACEVHARIFATSERLPVHKTKGFH